MKHGGVEAAAFFLSALVLAGCTSEKENSSRTILPPQPTVNPVTLVLIQHPNLILGHEMEPDNDLVQKISESLSYALSLNYITGTDDITQGSCILLFKKGKYLEEFNRRIDRETMSARINRLAAVASGFVCSFYEGYPSDFAIIFGLREDPELYAIEGSKSELPLPGIRKSLGQDVMELIARMTFHFEVDDNGKVTAPDEKRLLLILQDPGFYLVPGTLDQ